MFNCSTGFGVKPVHICIPHQYFISRIIAICPRQWTFMGLSSVVCPSVVAIASCQRGLTFLHMRTLHWIGTCIGF